MEKLSNSKEDSVQDENGNGTTPSEAALLGEYNIVEQSWKFLQGMRFATIAFAATLFTALISAYHVILAGMQQVSPKGLGEPALLFIAVLGILSIVAIFVLEQRLRLMYAACSRRGRDVEKLLGIDDGLFHRLHDVPHPLHPMSHSVLIYLVLVFVLTAWVVLIIFTYLKI